MSSKGNTQNKSPVKPQFTILFKLEANLINNNNKKNTEQEEFKVKNPSSCPEEKDRKEVKLFESNLFGGEQQEGGHLYKLGRNCLGKED